ncbi:MAG: ABC transporter substrate-binding protein [Armatimonadota bacterium]|nr:ABC transporter substrate-binding protein [Armatimonadota bacterium]
MIRKLLPLVVLLGWTAAAFPSAPIPVVRIAWWTDVGFPSPFAFSTVGPGGVVRLTLLYDSLLWKDERGLVPWLAEAYRLSADATAYVFRLRSGVRWHDGRPLGAWDVRFTFAYFRKHPFRWVDTGVVQDVEVRDRQTAVVRLSRPFAPFLENVAAVVPIIPEHVWKPVTFPEQLQELRAVVGSGPYRLAEYRPEAGQYRFVAFEGYFRGAPRVQEVRYVVVPLARQVLSVQSGEVDLAMTLAPEAVELFRSHPYLRVMVTEPLSVARLVFNLDHPLAGQKRFRQAVAHAVDVAGITRLVTREAGVPGSQGVVRPGDPWYTPEVRRYVHDPARARGLLRELGYEDRDGDGYLEARDGTRLVVEVLTSAPRETEPVLQSLARAGIEARARVADPATRAQLASEGRFVVLYTTHVGAGGDPDYLRTWFSGEEANAFARGSALRHPEFLRTAHLQAEAVDPSRRRALVHRLQRILAEELPTVVLFWRPFFWIYDSRKLAPLNTRGGMLNGIPLAENKLAFLAR